MHLSSNNKAAATGQQQGRVKKKKSKREIKDKQCKEGSSELRAGREQAGAGSRQGAGKVAGREEQARSRDRPRVPIRDPLKIPA